MDLLGSCWPFRKPLGPTRSCLGAEMWFIVYCSLWDVREPVTGQSELLSVSPWSSPVSDPPGRESLPALRHTCDFNL